MAGHWTALSVTCVVAMLSIPGGVRAETHLNALANEGERLAALLRAGRGVVSANQDLINDSDIGDKGLDSGRFLALVDARYRETNGAGPLDGDLTAHQRAITEAQLAAMAEGVDENQELINTQGMGFKGFIPAVFARLVNERFDESVGDAVRVKVTAPHELVRNRRARPDDWEDAVIEEKFKSGDWLRGDAFFEEISDANGTTFRMLIPEYYDESCLTCHGSPAGEVDITGFPKEGRAEGDLAGAISITLRQ